MSEREFAMEMAVMHEARGRMAGDSNRRRAHIDAAKDWLYRAARLSDRGGER